MSLNRRQKVLYRHTCDVWNVSRAIDTLKRPGAETYTLVAPGTPCIYNFTPNIDSEFPAGGRIKEFTMLVLDAIFMEANVPIEDMSVCVNVTLLANGQKSNAWGQIHRVEGPPTITDTLGRRKCNDLFVKAMSMEHPPPIIAAFYGIRP